MTTWIPQSKDSSSWSNGVLDVTTFTPILKVLSYLLQESGFFLLQETGDKLVLDLNFESSIWTNLVEH